MSESGELVKEAKSAVLQLKEKGLNVNAPKFTFSKAKIDVIPEELKLESLSLNGESCASSASTKAESFRPDYTTSGASTRDVLSGQWNSSSLMNLVDESCYHQSAMYRKGEFHVRNEYQLPESNSDSQHTRNWSTLQISCPDSPDGGNAAGQHVSYWTDGGDHGLLKISRHTPSLVNRNATFDMHASSLNTPAESLYFPCPTQSLYVPISGGGAGEHNGYHKMGIFSPQPSPMGSYSATTPGMSMAPRNAGFPASRPGAAKTPRSAEPIDGYIYQVQFKRAHKNFVLAPSAPRDIIPGDFVKVEADRGEDMGIVLSKAPAHDFEEVIPTAGYRGRGFSSGQGERKFLFRVATPDERASLAAKVADEEHALATIREKSAERGLPMVILDAEYQFDRHKLTFFFEAERRIDFRELVSELFSQYKTRIWMQQVDTSVLPSHDAGSELAKATGFLPTHSHASHTPQQLSYGGARGRFDGLQSSFPSPYGRDAHLGAQQEAFQLGGGGNGGGSHASAPGLYGGGGGGGGGGLARTFSSHSMAGGASTRDTLGGLVEGPWSFSSR